MSRRYFGHAFERDVERIFESCGYVSVRSNQWLVNYDFNLDKAVKREFDLVMFYPGQMQFYIIECKSHINNENLVSKGDVKDFYTKLKSHGRGARRMIVTDTGFTRDARDYAKFNSIVVVDGGDLEKLRKQGNLLKGILLKTLRIGLDGFYDYVV